MADVIDSFFEQYATPQYRPFLADIVGTCRFDIEGVGSWIVTIKKGIMTITKSSSNAAADCVITGSEQDFVRMIEKQQNPMTAFLQGRITVSGELSLATLGLRLFRMQPETFAALREGGQIR